MSRQAVVPSRAPANPPVPSLAEPPESAPTETLADALDAAYRTSPTLAASRYDLRSADEDYALALAETRLTTQVQLTGQYSRTTPGRITNAERSPLDRLSSPDITSKIGNAQIIADQPLYTGGRATADRDVAAAAIGAGRAQLRGTEGDLFLQIITSYADIRRDTRALGLRAANLKQLEATLAEVVARREAGELTRTDIAQAETQLDLARAQYNSAEQQLEQDRAVYRATVGHAPGVLAPEPPLPHLPRSIDDAFDVTAQLNPELAQAIATERASRSRIAAAAAQGRSQLSLRGTGTLSDQLVPFHAYNADRGYAGQLVLTIPLTNGGRVGALVAQARDRDAGDQLRIEVTRREIVQQIVNAWNALATAERNVAVETAQVASARVLNEGTFEEYRAGLRSTFDVLFAQGSLRDAEIGLVGSRHDLYIAQAALLRQIGLLAASTMLIGTPVYDPSENLRRAARRGALPWDALVRAADRIGRPEPKPITLEQPTVPALPPSLAQGTAPPTANISLDPPVLAPSMPSKP